MDPEENREPSLPAEERDGIDGWIEQALPGPLRTTPSPGEELLTRLSERADIGRYEVSSEVGRGGMGIVHRVWDGDLDRPLAMKVMSGPGGESSGPFLDPRRLNRFLTEAQVTGQLDHPGIVPVHELGLDSQGRAYFTMKLVEGQSLADVLESLREGDRQWSQRRVLNVLLRVCEAMSYAHEKGVVHRDLKPSNVMVGGHGEVYVMDWGLARVLDRADAREPRLQVGAAVEGSLDTSSLATRDGTVIGTPCYMPPEQAMGRIAEVDARSDVYAVGAMLYELLAGVRPYGHRGPAPTPESVLARVIDGPPQSIRRLASRSAPELVAICERAMARERDARYADIGELGEDLRSFLEHRAVSAHRTGPIGRVTKLIQRHPGISGTISVSLVVLLAVLTPISFQLEKESSAAEDERSAAEGSLGFLESFVTRTLETLDGRVAKSILDQGLSDAESADLHPRVLARVRTRLGAGYFVLGFHDEAQMLLDQALAYGQEHLTEDSAQRADLLEQYARLLAETGRSEAALSMAEQSLAMLRELHGEGHDGTIRLRHFILYWTELSFPERESGLRELRASARSSLGAQNLVTLQLEEALAHHLIHTRQLERAEAQVRDTLALFEARFGRDHPKTILAGRLRVALHEALDRREEMAALQEDLLERLRPYYGDRSPRMAGLRSELAATYQKLGRHDEAYSLQLELVEYAAELYTDPLHPSRIAVLNNLGLFLTRLGRYDEAEPIFAQLYERRVEANGLESGETAQALLNWGTNDSQAGRIGSATERLRESVRIYEATMGRVSHPSINAVRTLGAHLRNAGDYARAEPWLLESVERAKQFYGPDQPQTWRSAGSLIELYRLWERMDEARAHTRDLVEWTRADPAAHESAQQLLSELQNH